MENINSIPTDILIAELESRGYRVAKKGKDVPYFYAKGVVKKISPRSRISKWKYLIELYDEDMKRCCIPGDLKTQWGYTPIGGGFNQRNAPAVGDIVEVRSRITLEHYNFFPEKAKITRIIKRCQDS